MDAVKFQKLLERCKDYVPFKEEVYSSGHKFQEFCFTEETVEMLMGLRFGCKRCGSCCIDADEQPCGYLHGDGELKGCNIHEMQNYPVSCYSHPFIIDEIFTDGWGRRWVGKYDPIAHKKVGEYTRWEFGLIGGVLTLIIHPTAPCWDGGKPLREHYINVLDALSRGSDAPLNPPHVTLAQAILPSTGETVKIKYAELEASAQKLHQKLKSKEMRRIFEERLFKAKYNDFSLII